MGGVEILPFADEHLNGAAVVLAERHRRHRAVEPLLPQDADFRAEIETEWRGNGASGAVAIDSGDVVGFLVGHRREDAVGPPVWSSIAGNAVRVPELTRDLYRVASARWVKEGLTRHFVFVPKLDDLIEPWFRLGFGASAALATRETEPVAVLDRCVSIRLSTPDDLETAVVYDRVLGEHLAQAPSFGGLPVPTRAESLAEWQGTWSEEQFTHFVAERDGRPVGHLLLYRRPADLRVPADSIDLANAVSDPGKRGFGIGLALTAHVLTWAHAHGYPTMTTDWRMTNLEASRFWPRRGFRETFLRLSRSIP